MKQSSKVRTRPILFLVVALLAGILALRGTPAAHAAGILVNSAADTTVSGDGECTLREAINNANSNSDTTGGDCTAGSGADTITFAADYTITLVGSQLPAVTSELTITGNGAANTIIQANAAPDTATYRVFEVTSTGNLTLDGVTVRHGQCVGGCNTFASRGGGIYNNGGTLTVTNGALSGNSANFGGGIFNNLGTLTVTNSALSGNSATNSGGGINNGGTLTVTNSALSGNSANFGGGIHNRGTLTVTNSALSGNSAGGWGGGITNFSSGTLTVTNSALSGNSANFGGGIYNTGTVTVTNSALSGNSAGSRGGGIHNTGTTTVTNSALSDNSAGSEGGGIDNSFNGTMTVTNSTLSGNSATFGGGIYNESGTTTVTNSTLSGNSAGEWGGGIANFVGTMNVSRSLVSGNNANHSGNEIYHIASFFGHSGTFNANDYNVFGHSGQSNFNAYRYFTPGANDFNATSGAGNVALASILDTALANNGGPTETHALVEGSPAIDFAGACGLSTDQRGVTRPQGAACDAGAFELVTNQPPTADAGGPYLVAANSSIAFDGSGSSDPDDDPLTETWSADGGTVAGSAYTAGDVPGIYDVCLTVNDGTVDSDPDCTFVVVYDPSAGFVTGGGWIDSPAGAYTADPDLTGRANFGFVARYKSGANTPDGHTNFQFRAGDFHFTSTSYDWLVVAGNRAQFKGEGAVNGAGGYQFMIWADDDSPDTFRIRIWDDDGTVYDNGAQQTLGGGNIVIHRK